MQDPFRACPACGARVGATARFCGYCGRTIPEAPAARSSRTKTVALAAVAAVALVAAGVGAGLLVRSNAGGPGGSPGPGDSPGAGASGPTTALATPPIVDGFADESALVPPILEEGEVPAPEDPTPPLIGHLTLGPATDLASQTIGAGGGTLAAGGFEIQVPDGALPGDTSFEVTQAPITGQDFGDLITPLTPLYTVDDGEADLAAPVTVVLPATIPDGATTMAFYYDDASGTLSPLMPISQDASSITVAAPHFSGIFGAVIDWAKVPATVDSGFRPGQDDWQFTNYGSYVAPGGHCEGQSVSAIWYYLNQRRKGGASPLYGLYDNNGAAEKTPILWPDDSDGYRFVSSLQAAGVADRFSYLFLRNTMWDSPDGRLTYDAFRAAIAFSGQPQMIRLSPAPGDGGHTMIVYRVTPDRLFVADPNYPGTLRTIRYDVATGKLGPYSSGSNAADIAANGATVYTRIAYVPWQSSKSEAGISAHWAEFEAGTAGDRVFPKYTLEVMAGVDDSGVETWVPLVDGYRTTERTLTIRMSDPAKADHVLMRVYRDTSSIMAAGGRQVTIDVEDGENPLGIAEFGSKAGWADWEYVDFVRLTVTSGPPTAGEWALTASAGRTVRPNDPEASLAGYAFELHDQLIRLTHWEPTPDTEGNATGSRITGTSTVAWNFLPDRAVPGDTWQATLSVEPGCEPLTPFRIKISVVADDNPPESGVDVAYLEQELCQLSEMKGSFTFPAVSNPRSPASSLQVAVSMELPGVNAGEWIYTYTWQP